MRSKEELEHSLADHSNGSFVAFLIKKDLLEIVPATAARSWMTPFTRAALDHCLPVRMASQFGWFVLNSEPCDITWYGEDSPDSLEIRLFGRRSGVTPTSHFGGSILTWKIPYLFRTPPGYNLLVRGPANQVKDGISALDGLVETDWSPASFTMNWKLTRPGLTVTFLRSEPICMLIPQRRSELEGFTPSIRPLEITGELAKEHRDWADSRERFLQNFSEQQRQGKSWQKHYFQGSSVSGKRFTRHQTKMVLQPFANCVPSEVPKEQLSGDDIEQPSECSRFTWVEIRDPLPEVDEMRQSFEAEFEKDIWKQISVDGKSYFLTEASNVLGSRLTKIFLQRLQQLATDRLGLLPDGEPECRVYLAGNGEEPGSDPPALCVYYSYSLGPDLPQLTGGELIFERSTESQTCNNTTLKEAKEYETPSSGFGSLVLYSGLLRKGVRRNVTGLPALVTRLSICGKLVPQFSVTGVLSKAHVVQPLEDCRKSFLLGAPNAQQVQGFAIVRFNIDCDRSASRPSVLLNLLSGDEESQGKMFHHVCCAIQNVHFLPSSGSTSVIYPVALNCSLDRYVA